MRRKGQAFVEMLVAMIVLSIIGLLILDVATLVLASTANDMLVKSAARAAASATNAQSKGTATAAAKAATTIVSHAKTSSIIQNFNIALIKWNGQVVQGSVDPRWGQTGSTGDVCVVSSITVVPPARLHSSNKITLFSKAIEPIVSIQP